MTVQQPDVLKPQARDEYLVLSPPPTQVALARATTTNPYPVTERHQAHSRPPVTGDGRFPACFWRNILRSFCLLSIGKSGQKHRNALRLATDPVSNAVAS